MPLAIRPIKIVRPFLKHGEGSCLFQMGRTKVLCVASVSGKVPPHAEEKGTGWISAEYSMLPRAGSERTHRRRASGGGRVQEISRLIGRSLRAAVDMSRMPGKSIIVDCDVLQADGGTRTTSVNGGFIALVDALRGLYRSGEILEWPLRGSVAAVSSGLFAGKPVLDLAYEQDVDADVDLNVVMDGSGRLIEIQGTAEGKPFPVRDLNRLVGLAQKGIRKITARQKKVLRGFGPPKRRAL